MFLRPRSTVSKTQTFSTRWHKLKLQIVAVSSIVSQGRHTPALRCDQTIGSYIYISTQIIAPHQNKSSDLVFTLMIDRLIHRRPCSTKRNPGPGYNTLLLRLIPGDLLMPVSIDNFKHFPAFYSVAALSNSYCQIPTFISSVIILLLFKSNHTYCLFVFFVTEWIC